MEVEEAVLVGLVVANVDQLVAALHGLDVVEQHHGLLLLLDQQLDDDGLVAAQRLLVDDAEDLEHLDELRLLEALGNGVHDLLNVLLGDLRADDGIVAEELRDKVRGADVTRQVVHEHIQVPVFHQYLVS